MELPNDLYPYQKEDVVRILADNDNWLLLSEMGTGKTPIALGVSELGTWPGKTLIVCPKTLQLEWARQIREWCGIEPSVAKRSAYKKLQTLFDEYFKGTPAPYFITNYETFRVERHLDILRGYPFGLIIMDEAHQLRNIRTKQTRGMLDFLSTQQRAKKVILTGSPIVNNPADLHTLLCIVRPDLYSTRQRQQFIDQYCYYKRRRGGGVKVLGVRNMEGLRRETEDFTIRRSKAEVLPFLPEKYYRRVILEMDDDQRGAYDNMRKDLMVLLDSGEPIWAASVLAQLTRLRQLNLEPSILGVNASSSKTDFLFEFMEEMGIGDGDMYSDNGEQKKLVVFSCFETYINQLSQKLRGRGINHVVISGKIANYDRAKAVELFQNDPSVQVVAGTVQTMGVGVTLTAASNCVFMDRWWNPAVNNQAIDRLHRIGQRNGVQIVLPINDKSIDDSLDKILTDKARLSKEYLNDQEVMREVVEDMREQFRMEDHFIEEESDGVPSY